MSTCAAKGGEGGKVVMRPQFGAQGGKDVAMTEESFCTELRRSAQAFQSMTGQPMVPLWRAPGGHTSPKTLAWAEQCGFKHVGWAPAGFLGDELSSERYPNQVLLERRCAICAMAISRWPTWVSGRARTPGRRACWSR
jgi:hypothetical protein